jgi:hypothetical protein
MNKITKVGIVVGSAGMLLAGLVAGVSAQTANESAQVAGTARAVGSTIELHINNNGKVLIRGIKVSGVSGNIVSGTIAWGSYSLPISINGASVTKVARRFGGTAEVSEISAGDFISVEGSLDQTQSALTVNATFIKDWSIQKKAATFSGTVSSVNASSTSFVLASRERGNVTVTVTASTTIMKGNQPATFADIAQGATISSVSGIWDTVSNTLTANKVRIYVNEQVLNKRTFEGTLQAIGGTTAPTTLTVQVDNTTYTVNVAANTTLITNKWNATTLSAMAAGNTVRVYGSVEANNTSTIDALVVRDVSIK